MIKINKSPVLTSKNYGVNFFEIDGEALQFKPNCKVDVNVKNCQNQLDIKTDNIPQSNIGLEFSKQLLNSSNFSKTFEINRDTDEPLQICFNNNQTLIGIINFKVNSGIRASVILKVNSNINAYNNLAINIILNNDACLDFAIICDLESSSNNFVSISSKCEINSHLNLNVVNFGSANSVQNIKINLNGELSRTSINSIYFGGSNEKLSINYLVNQFGKKSKCNIDVCGVLSNNAYKNFLGTIDFKKGSNQSEGSESEHCIMLSNNVKANSTPILLSAEEDVNGSHSSSYGKIDDDELFYIMSRGISKVDAIKLLVKAKLIKLVNCVIEDNLKQEIFKRIDEKIDEQNWKWN